RLGWITKEDCNQAFLIPAWATLVLYSMFSVFMQVGANASTKPSGPTVHLVYAFVQIGFFYYGLIGFNRKSKIHYVLALPFILYIISTGQRALLLSTLGTYGLFVLLRGSFARLVVFVPASLCGLVALLGALYLLNPDYMTDLALRTEQALVAVATGQPTGDTSSAMRLEETAVALPYIKNSILMGNGDLSKRWHGGYPGVLQGYFFPSDIGLLGVVYMYGLLGLGLFALQFWWARKYSKRASQGTDTPPMTDAVMAFLIAYAVLSLEAGTFVGQFQTGILAVMYLYILSDERKSRTLVPRNLVRRFSFAALRGLQRPS
ncbi:MAG: hypothetical protein ACREBW_04380, partial [Candidatus Micrarchaeaceae archaeon]